MKESLISFETAKLAKEKGFNEYCLKFYTSPDDIKHQGNGFDNTNNHASLLGFIASAPTQSLLQKWLWETYRLFVYIRPFWKEDKFQFGADILEEKTRTWHKCTIKKTPEKALEAGLVEALKLI